ncbi:hypothetical protein GCM10010431_56120 [Streptomyces kunmingensis]
MHGIYGSLSLKAAALLYTLMWLPCLERFDAAFARHESEACPALHAAPGLPREGCG